MPRTRSRSAGVRHPGRKTLVFGIATLLALGGAVAVIADMRATGRADSPWLALALPALLCPMLFGYYASRARVFQNLRSGRTAIARWTVPADEFGEFQAHEARFSDGSPDVNFYRPPATVPVAGIEVIFSDCGVLIDGGWFPLSLTGSCRVQAVDYLAEPPAVEFTLRLATTVRTTSAPVPTLHELSMLRVPVARAARTQARTVVERYRAQLRTH